MSCYMKLFYEYMCLVNEGCMYNYVMALRGCLSVNSSMAHYLYIAPSITRGSLGKLRILQKKRLLLMKRGLL